MASHGKGACPHRAIAVEDVDRAKYANSPPMEMTMPAESTLPPDTVISSGVSRRSGATVTMGFVTGMLTGLRRQSCDLSDMLAVTGIDLADVATRISAERYAELYNLAVAEAGDEGFALFSRRLERGTFEFLCRGMLGAPTLAEAMQRACRFLALVLPDLRVEIRQQGRQAELIIAETFSLADRRDDPGRIFAFEWLLRLLHGLACWFVARSLALDTVDFPYPRPSHADDYALVYTENSRFDSDVLTARFRANLLELPIRRDEAALNAFLDGAPGRITLLYRRDRETVFRVRDLLRDALPENRSLAEVAARLHLSSRTLVRRLAEEGSSFRAIKAAIRRDIAYSRLTKTRLPVERLAAELGYADPSAFYRAFVHWSGMSPERFRSRLGRREANLPLDASVPPAGSFP